MPSASRGRGGRCPKSTFNARKRQNARITPSGDSGTYGGAGESPSLAFAERIGRFTVLQWRYIVIVAAVALALLAGFFGDGPGNSTQWGW